MINFHADDYGYDTTVDDRMLLLLRAKKLTGVSVLSTMVSKTSLKKLANALSGRRSPRIALHLNLTENHKNHSRRPDKNRKSATVRLFNLMFRVFTGQLSKPAIEKEIEHQLKILTNAGIKVTAIDSHQHVHALSPIAEAVITVARKHKIKYIRSYRDAQRYTLIAQIKYRFLQGASLISHLFCYRRLGLPITWKISGDSIAVMSWEGKNMSSRGYLSSRGDPERITGLPRHSSLAPRNDVVYITHPFLPFDSNTSYYRLLDIPSVIASETKQSLSIKITTSASRRTRDDKLKGGDTS